MIKQEIKTEQCSEKSENVNKFSSDLSLEISQRFKLENNTISLNSRFPKSGKGV